jgi:hypothetical protein
MVGILFKRVFHPLLIAPATAFKRQNAAVENRGREEIG